MHKRSMIGVFLRFLYQCTRILFLSSVAEPNHFYAFPAPDPAPGKNFDAAPAPAAPAPAAPAPAPTLLYGKAKFLK
jgi:hypothetical protein